MHKETNTQPLRFNVSEARDKFRDIVDDVYHRGHVVILQRYNNDQVAMVPISAYEDFIVMSNADRDAFLAALKKPPKPTSALKRAAARHSKQTSE